MNYKYESKKTTEISIMNSELRTKPETRNLKPASIFPLSPSPCLPFCLSLPTENKDIETLFY